MRKYKKEVLILVIILVIILFSLVVSPGYKVFIDDHEVYMPQIYHSQNPHLYPNDLLMKVSLLKYTFFDEFIDVAQKILPGDIFTTFLVLTFFFRFIYYYSIYKLAFYFSDNETYSFLAMLLFIPGFFVYGYPVSTVDPSLVPRSISLPLNLLSLLYLFNKMWFKSLMLLLLSSLIHPITAIPFIIIFLLRVFLTANKKYLKYFLMLIILTSLLLFLLINNRVLTSDLSILTSLDSTWESIIFFKNPYYFIGSWNYQILNLIGDTLLFIVVLQEGRKIFKDEKKRKQASLLFFIPLTILIFYFVTVEIFKMLFFIQLQLLRGLIVWKIFSILFFTYFAYQYVRKHPTNILQNFFFIGLLISLIFTQSFIFPLPNKESLKLIFLPGFIYICIWDRFRLKKNWVIFSLLLLFSFGLSRMLMIRIIQLIPLLFLVLTITFFIRAKLKLISKYQYLFQPISLAILVVLTIISPAKFKIIPEDLINKPFIDACNWIKNNTSINNTFLTEPFTSNSSSIRILCYRNVWISYKDGSIGQFNRLYAFEWKRRMDLVNKLKDNYEILPQILSQYHIDYIFSDSKLKINYPEVFNNQKYYIYQLKKIS